MIAVPFLMLLVFGVYPFIQGITRAFFNYNGGNRNDFVGLQNFIDIANSAIFRQSLVNGLLLMAFAIVTTTLIPLWTAWMVHHFTSSRLKYLFRILVMLPVIVPTVVALLIWARLLRPDGALNAILRAVGLEVLAKGWLTDQSVVLIGIMLVGLPWLAGVNCLLYLGGFGNIPRELYEAAELDGGRRWAIFRHVEFPFVSVQTKIILTLGIIGGLQAYENVYILTGGGPNDASIVPGLVLFRSAFSYGQYGYASAVAVVIMLVTLAILGAGMLILKIGARRG